MSRVIFLWILGAAVLAGCSSVHSVHPLTDARSSVVDDRLAGQWLPVNTKEPMTIEKPEDPLDRIVIRKAKGDGVWYEVTVTNRPDDSMTLFVAKIGDLHFMSARGNEAGPEPARFAIAQYEFPKADEIRFYALDPQLAAEAIRRGQIAGAVGESEPPDDDPNATGETHDVMLTAKPDELRRFFATPEGKGLVHTAEPVLVMKRVGK
jgi:hypothetical protein